MTRPRADAGLVHLVVPGDPPRKNERHEIVRNRNTGKPIRKNTDAFDGFVSELRCAANRERVQCITEGAWQLTVHAFWGRLRHLDDGDFAFGDHDAPLSCVSDALQAASVLDDDVRITESICRKSYDKENPRTEIVLRRLKGGA